MQTVKAAVSSSARLAYDASKLAGDGVSHIWGVTYDVAGKAKLNLEEAYLTKRTNITVDFIPSDVQDARERFENTSNLLQEVTTNIKKRVDSETASLRSFEASAKSFTALDYAFLQSSTPSKERAQALAEGYDRLRTVSEVHVKTVAAVHMRLQTFIEEDMSEGFNLLRLFDQRVQEMHIIKSEAHTMQQSDGPHHPCLPASPPRALDCSQITFFQPTTINDQRGCSHVLS